MEKNIAAAIQLIIIGAFIFVFVYDIICNYKRNKRMNEFYKMINEINLKNETSI